MAEDRFPPPLTLGAAPNSGSQRGIP
ncbi:hypothetical protein WH367_10785 [Comamonas sp. MYb21]